MKTIKATGKYSDIEIVFMIAISFLMGCVVFWALRLGGDYERSVQTSNWRGALWELVNDYREEQGLQPFAEDGELCGLAVIRSYEAQKEWGHIGPNSIYHDYTATQYCPDCEGMGENLAKDFNTPQGVINGWVESPMHKHILLMDASSACIGVSENEEGELYTALIVGK